ncbi:NTP-PPase_u5 domain containing protein [uncultured Caudovirales phage]|uniref:NTP-PPase_u5 domain containing protein n=1 Tax=uncultured Caudovirales phage TaxID=2100421 RepID=A0A6J5NZ05_9CAUD|nr:NTP-PPase_u5 domain containing protein [uncultured Caudovirales phage]
MDIATPYTKGRATYLVGDMSAVPSIGPVTCADGFRYLAIECHARAVVAGWWDKPRNAGESIALMHSELSEALEGVRKGTQDEHLPEFTSEEVELADSLIRILDYAGARQLRLGEAFVAKLLYNANRADHKPEARAAAGGKKF